MPSASQVCLQYCIWKGKSSDMLLFRFLPQIDCIKINKTALHSSGILSQYLLPLHLSNYSWCEFPAAKTQNMTSHEVFWISFLLFNVWNQSVIVQHIQEGPMSPVFIILSIFSVLQMKTLAVCNIWCLTGGFWENASCVIKLFITFLVVQLLKGNKSCNALKMSKNENWKEKSSGCELWSLCCWELPEAWHAGVPEKALSLLDSWCSLHWKRARQGSQLRFTLLCVQL